MGHTRAAMVGAEGVAGVGRLNVRAELRVVHEALRGVLRCDILVEDGARHIGHAGEIALRI